MFPQYEIPVEKMSTYSTLSDALGKFSYGNVSVMDHGNNHLQTMQPNSYQNHTSVYQHQSPAQSIPDSDFDFELAQYRGSSPFGSEYDESSVRDFMERAISEPGEMESSFKGSPMSDASSSSSQSSDSSDNDSFPDLTASSTSNGSDTDSDCESSGPATPPATWSNPGTVHNNIYNSGPEQHYGHSSPSIHAAYPELDHAQGAWEAPNNVLNMLDGYAKSRAPSPESTLDGQHPFNGASSASLECNDNSGATYNFHISGHNIHICCANDTIRFRCANASAQIVPHAQNMTDE